MSTATFVEDFKEGLEFVPVKGQPNLYFIHTAEHEASAHEEKMLSEDWNEFERHIAEAFERIP